MDYRDDDIQLNRRNRSWNNSDTEAINWFKPSEVASRVGPIDITTSDNKGAPMEMKEIM